MSGGGTYTHEANGIQGSGMLFVARRVGGPVGVESINPSESFYIWPQVSSAWHNVPKEQIAWSIRCGLTTHLCKIFPPFLSIAGARPPPQDKISFRVRLFASESHLVLISLRSSAFLSAAIIMSSGNLCLEVVLRISGR